MPLHGQPQAVRRLSRAIRELTEHPRIHPLLTYLRLVGRIALLGLLLCGPVPTWADALEINAPASLKPLLEKNLDLAWGLRQKDAQFSAAAWRELYEKSRRTAQELLETEGYFSPRIDSSFAQTAQGWTARFQVDPGPRTRVAHIDLRLTGAVAQSPQAQRLQQSFLQTLPLQAGMPFTQQGWSAAKREVVQGLAARRYAAARIAASEALIDPALHTATLHLVVDSGPAYAFGPLKIQGLKRYPAALVERLCGLPHGNAYQQDKLLECQRNLEQSGYFQSAAVQLDNAAQDAAAAPVLVRVEEAKPYKLTLGAGYGTDTGPRAQAQWLQRDFAARAMQLKFATLLENTQQQASAELAWPPDADRYLWSLGSAVKRTDIEGQVTRAMQILGKRTRKQGAVESTLVAQFQVERQSAGGVLQESNRALSLNYIWTHHTAPATDYPRRGWVSSVQVGGALKSLLSDQSFLRLYWRHLQFLPIGVRDRLVGRLELGATLASSTQGIPTDFLFRAGGANSVRGYAFQSLGPRLNDSVVSGRYLFTSSVEYDHFFTPTWGAAVFVDAGQAANSLGALHAQVGVGPGLRYRSPVGPVNLDVAYGVGLHEWRLHFSLGVSF